MNPEKNTFTFCIQPQSAVIFVTEKVTTAALFNSAPISHSILITSNYWLSIFSQKSDQILLLFSTILSVELTIYLIVYLTYQSQTHRNKKQWCKRWWQKSLKNKQKTDRNPILRKGSTADGHWSNNFYDSNMKWLGDEEREKFSSKRIKITQNSLAKAAICDEKPSI